MSRAYTVGEEIASSVTHGVGLAAAVAASIWLVARAAAGGSAMQVASDTIYAVTIVALYGASTFYHAIPHPRAKPLLRALDHSAIYLLIAGTYTPFALLNLHGPWGTGLAVIVWTLAVLGIVFTALSRHRMSRWTLVVYLLMGWLAVAYAKPMLAHVAPGGVAWLVAGGLLYTGGVVFYAWDRLRYGHAVWHLFVLGGSACHFVAVFRYAVPG
jgi:hemolysin III